MKTKNVLLPAITGTTLMSIFSYITSNLQTENFKEPKLLAEIVKKAFLAHQDKLPMPVGWAMHYAMGCMMTLAFQHAWRGTNTIPSTKQGLAAGLISGIGGVLIWKTMFKIHPNPPKVSFKRLAGHLLLAHVVFALAVAYTSQLEEPFEPYIEDYIGSDAGE